MLFILIAIWDYLISNVRRIEPLSAMLIDLNMITIPVTITAKNQK